jgi:phytoene dehydrogenase-like protein
LRDGVDTLLLEAQDDVGGRVRTDPVDGFRLDRGFQVLQTAYPEAQQQLDYQALRLRKFEPGALIRTRGRTVRMTDPWRRPQDLISTTLNGVGNLGDRWKLARLRRHVTRGSLDDLWAEPDSTTAEYLRSTCGFSSDMVERFFRPWFAGVFLEDELTTSSRFFKFVFRMFALGDAALPENGMGAITKQLADGIPPSMLRLSTRVESLNRTQVRLEGGETINGRALVLAVEGPEAARLTAGRSPSPEFLATTCIYFAADSAPQAESMLVLNGDRSAGDRNGPINNLCVPSNVTETYAPAGKSLVSVSVVGGQASDSAELELAVRRQLREWYGGQVDRWSLLRSYHIRHALPNQPAHFRDAAAPLPRLAEGLYRCGDYCETASIQGAMLSGRKAAEAVFADLGSGGG